MAMKFKSGQRVKVKNTGHKGMIAPNLKVWQDQYFIHLDNGQATVVSGSSLLPSA